MTVFCVIHRTNYNGSGFLQIRHEVIICRCCHQNIAFLEFAFHFIPYFDDSCCTADFLCANANAFAQYIANDINTQGICGTADAYGHTQCHNDGIAVFHQTALLSHFHSGVKYLTFGDGRFMQYRTAAPYQVHLTPYLIAHGTCRNRAYRSVFGNHSCSKTRFCDGGNAGCFQFCCCGTCCKADSICDIGQTCFQTLCQVFAIIDAAFCFFSDSCHGCHCFTGVFAHGCFTRKHDGIRAVKDGVCNVICFRTGRSRAFYHAFQHLCCCDDRFAASVCQCNQRFLYQRHFFRRDFHTQIPSGYHDTIGNFQNFFDVVYTFLIFNLGNNLDIFAAVFFQHFPNLHNVRSGTDERCRYIIKIIFDTEFQVRNIFFCQRRQIYLHAGQVYAFTGAYVAASHNFTVHFGTNDAFYPQFNETIVNKHTRAFLQVFRQVCISYGNTFLCAGYIFCCQGEFIPLFQTNFIVFKGFDTNFRTLCIQNQWNGCIQFFSCLFQFFDNFSMSFISTVGEVHSCCIQTVADQLFHDLYIICCRTQGTNDFRSAHGIPPLIFIPIRLPGS